MAELRHTLDWVSDTDVTKLLMAISRGWSSPLVAVGSGGSFSAASHLARLHRTFFRQVAAAATPYRLASEPIANNATHWIFSAGGSNVDVIAAVRACQLGEPDAVNVLTMQERSRVATLCRENPFLTLHVLATPTKKDGFLATNSLLAFCALMSRCYLNAAGRHNEWYGVAASLSPLADPTSSRVATWLEEYERVRLVDHLVVLHGGETTLGGIDLESKFVEAGIKDVQLADYRHFAHGRHHWLAKNGDSTGLLVFISDSDRKLADQTLRVIPKGIPCSRIDVEGRGERAELGSLLATFHLTAQAGFSRGIDPGQPGVPDFGRKLYGLRIPEPVVPSTGAWAIRRKINAQGPDAPPEADFWRTNLERMQERLTSTRLAGVVLDYDGTVVDTARRFENPVPEIGAELRRLADGGVRIGIATGRGKSAGDSLRAVLPTSLWPQVLVGYYNGAEIIGLDSTDGPDRGRTPTAAIANVNNAIQARLATMPRMQVDLRPSQLTLTPRSAADEDALWTDVRELIDELQIGGVRLMRSSHSIDVVDRSASKLNVVSNVANPDYVLRIGDRGRWPGNDFEMLAHPLGLSVDQVSGHPDHCWNIAPPGLRGMRATLHYLRAITLNGDPLIRLSLT
ncbi:sucrose-6-phosphate hydrolase [Mycobacterium sp. 1164966.3]|uniref:sucrose-6-phosphate hydrolase n=1 Tax=Mycobacterium sp. 1164966.3 TaxID=1856861 RepID=UPI000A47B17A|nr:sucrose-6-phosphate hydrolase [Mycobacterium sp. 1164966.3]